MKDIDINILIVDDEPNLRKVLATLLANEGKVFLASNGKEAIKFLEENNIDLVITDQKMPEIDGIQLLRFVVEKYPYIPVIIITAFGSVDRAVEAIKMGAYDYITKPFDQHELKTVVKKALQSREWNSFDAFADESNTVIIGKSHSIKQIYNIIDRIADTPSSVLVTGESGTGKGLIARSLHEKSSRCNKPFIKINCAAIPKELIESELFGYEKGAFTGAVTSKPGKFELAHEGTLFLDEIGEITPDIQVKLLRAIQDGEFERVGGIKTIKVDVRLICATNIYLKDAISKGKFREDLYYRLYVVNIEMPPLRERKEDIPVLVEYFLAKYNKRIKKNITSVTTEAMEYLIKYKWPGNIRELENIIERCILFSDSNILTVKELPPEIKEFSSRLDFITPSTDENNHSFRDKVKSVTQKIERELIEKALKETNGNVTQAAKLLKLSRKGLQLKIKELGISSGVKINYNLDDE